MDEDKTIAQIAAELEAYDPQALPVSQVNDFLSLLVTAQTAIENVALMQSSGRVLAADVISPFSVPPHDNSAMDGFAFSGDVLQNGIDIELKIAGTALAGKAWQGKLSACDCIKITTGAVMPEGLDTVVPQELCSIESGKIRIRSGSLKRGDNRRFKGEDLKQGEVALQKGELLAPAALGLLASLNIQTVPVFVRLRVAYFSTGDEVLSLGQAPREGAIYDSNRYTVIAMLQRWGFEVIDMGVVRDEPALLEAAFLEAASKTDAIITSGGVSVGEADHTKAMMRKLGDVAFWRIAMRPGRPMAVGKIKKTDAKRLEIAQASSASSSQNHSCILFGLPGNPVATMVTMLAFVRPALFQMAGLRVEKYAAKPLYLKAVSQQNLRKKPGRTEYQRGLVSYNEQGALQVSLTTSNQGSGVLSSMVAANGLIVLHHGQGDVNTGDAVDVLMFDGVF